MLITLTYIAIFLVGLYGTFKIDKSSQPLSISVAIAIFSGAVISLFPHLFAPGSSKIVIEWYSIIGNGYMNLLKLVAIPLILLSILQALYRLKNSAGIGRILSTNNGDMLLQVKT